MGESIGAFKARWLVENIRPIYPLNLIHFSRRPELGLDKPVSIVPCDKLPGEVNATLIRHPHLNDDFILYNSSNIIERIRFSIAHELAHLVLGHKGYSIGDNEDQVMKKEADDFATELLLPYFKFMDIACINKNLDPISLVMKLRDKRYFWTSLESTCRRVLELELFTGAFILYDHLRPYFAYNSIKFDPCDSFKEDINSILITIKSTLARRGTISTTVEGLYIFARRFLSGQILASITTKDRIGYNIYNDLQKQWQSKLRIAD